AVRSQFWMKKLTAQSASRKRFIQNKSFDLSIISKLSLHPKFANRKKLTKRNDFLKDLMNKISQVPGWPSYNPGKIILPDSASCTGVGTRASTRSPARRMVIALL